ncbi:MAG: hypothetical protein ACI9NY_002459, partial [Kiritimatiellia bacterium]
KTLLKKQYRLFFYFQPLSIQPNRRSIAGGNPTRRWLKALRHTDRFLLLQNLHSLHPCRSRDIKPTFAINLLLGHPIKNMLLHFQVPYVPVGQGLNKGCRWTQHVLCFGLTPILQIPKTVPYPFVFWLLFYGQAKTHSSGKNVNSSAARRVKNKDTFHSNKLAIKAKPLQISRRCQAKTNTPAPFKPIIRKSKALSIQTRIQLTQP